MLSPIKQHTRLVALIIFLIMIFLIIVIMLCLNFSQDEENQPITITTGWEVPGGFVNVGLVMILRKMYC